MCISSCLQIAGIKMLETLLFGTTTLQLWQPAWAYFQIFFSKLCWCLPSLHECHELPKTSSNCLRVNLLYPGITVTKTQYFWLRATGCMFIYTWDVSKCPHSFKQTRAAKHLYANMSLPSTDDNPVHTLDPHRTTVVLCKRLESRMLHNIQFVILVQLLHQQII